jgi:putative pyruvate formate lyase activating enzyme
VFRHAPHLGEEPPLSGVRGSGTVFFSRCTLRCLYCQNYPWSQEGAGEACDERRLAEMFSGLAQRGCHNVNLVSPTPWLPQIREAWEIAGGSGALPPMVYNTSGFERPEVLEWMGETVGVFLTDLRYARPESAAEGSGFAGYAQCAREALLTMRRLTGPFETDGEGIARRGTICRLLVLPGRAEEAVENLRWLAGNAPGVAVSLMSQYTPAFRAAGRGDAWGRVVTRDEYDLAARELERLDFEDGWMQEPGAGAPEGLVGFTMTPGAS